MKQPPTDATGAEPGKGVMTMTMSEARRASVNNWRASCCKIFELDRALCGILAMDDSYGAEFGDTVFAVYDECMTWKPSGIMANFENAMELVHDLATDYLD